MSNEFDKRTRVVTGLATNQERKSRQRQGILDAGIKLFTHDGFKATHVATVAEAAGVSQVTLYKYFPSKLALGHQVVIEMINQGYASFQKLIDDEQVPFPEIIKAMIMNKVRLSDGIHPDFYQFVLAEMQGKNGSNVVRQTYEDGEQKFWGAVIARGRAGGIISEDISDEALLIYLHMYVSYFSTANIPPATYQRLVNQLMHLFFYGFAGTPAVTPPDSQASKEDD